MRILFSDEKFFDMDVVYNSQNDRVWAVDCADADKKGSLWCFWIQTEFWKSSAPSPPVVPLVPLAPSLLKMNFEKVLPLVPPTPKFLTPHTPPIFWKSK